MRIIKNTKTIASQMACDAICGLINTKPDAVLALAAGRSVTELYELIAQKCAAGAVSLKDVRIFELAAYEGNDYSRRFLEDKIINTTDADPANCFFLSGDRLDTYDEMIASCGDIDMAVLGIGANCHIGFNEPATPFDSLTHRQKLTDSTRRSKAYLFGGEDKVPEYGYTMGIKTIIDAKNISMLAFGESKAAPVYNMVYGKTMTYRPASFIQIPMNVTVYLDADAASML